MNNPFDAIGQALADARNRWNRQLRMRDPDFHITVTQEFRIELLKHPDYIQFMDSTRDGYRESKIMGVPFTVVVDESQDEPFRIWRSV